MDSTILGFPGIILCLAMAGGQYPNLYPGQNPSARPPESEHRLPSDQPEQVRKRPPRNSEDLLQIKRDADELAKLAGQIRPEIDEVGKGLLSKDLNEQLKRIEKLSKRVRRELNQ